MKRLRLSVMKQAALPWTPAQLVARTARTRANAAEVLNDIPPPARPIKEEGLAIRDIGVPIITKNPATPASRAMLDVTAIAVQEIPAAIAEVDDYFSVAGHTRCARWEMADTDAHHPLAETLHAEGYSHATLTCYRLEKLQTLELPTHNDLTIIPLRSALPAFRAASSTDSESPLLERRLDDTNLEGLIALRGTDAIAWATLYTDGELGLIDDWHATDPATLPVILNSILEIASRARLKYIVAAIINQSPATLARREWLLNIGFSPVGRLLRLDRSTAP